MNNETSLPPIGRPAETKPVAIAPGVSAPSSLSQTQPHTSKAGTHAPGDTSVLQAARALDQCARNFSHGLSVDDIVHDLKATLFSDDDADMLLHTQARILDTLFKRIAADDMHDTWNNRPVLREHKIDLALKTQRHCRNTVEALNRCRYRRSRVELAENGVE